jgi:hypothetical protein
MGFALSAGKIHRYRNRPPCLHPAVPVVAAGRMNWNDYPAFFKRGTYVRRQKVCRKFTTEKLDKLPPLHEARKDPNLMVERTDIVALELPPLARISNRVGVLFRGEEPQVSETKPHRGSEDGETE